MRAKAESSPAEKADVQRQAARDAVEMLIERLGPDLAQFVDLFDRASFRFRPALVERVERIASAIE